MGDLSFGKEEKKTPESSLSAMWGLQWQGAIRKPGREPHKKLVKHQLVAWFWISQSPEWWEINFCVCSLPICGILLQLFEQTGTIPTEFLQRVSKQSRDNRRAERRLTCSEPPKTACPTHSQACQWKWSAHGLGSGERFTVTTAQLHNPYFRMLSKQHTTTSEGELSFWWLWEKKFAFQGLFKDGLYHNHSFSYSRKALTATQGLCEDKVIRWFAELRSKLRDDHSLPRILLINHLHWIK